MALESNRQPNFPFSAIVGQSQMKKALILNAINPSIGGVLIRGNKGTAKSTAVRSLALLLPELNLIQGCVYNCDPDTPQSICEYCDKAELKKNVARPVQIVQLPVGATEDRLVGSLNIEEAIKTGTREFEPGLLATANKGILYIDEVNLLNDHLVDVLLDAAAMGRNYVEREGVSVSHEAQFILIGTMNPEEGDLRPQLLDRFGLAVEVSNEIETEARIEVVKRRMRFEQDPATFVASWDEKEELERKRIVQSRELLPEINVSDEMLYMISDICAGFGVDGLRGDIVMYKTAITIAAYEGRTEVNSDDVRESAIMALLHRQRRQPFQEPSLDQEKLDEIINQENIGQNNSRESSESSGEQESSSDDPGPAESDQTDEQQDAEDQNGSESFPDTGKEEIFEIGLIPKIKQLEMRADDHKQRTSFGRRAETNSASGVGYYVSSRVPKGKLSDLALDATLRAAAPLQKHRMKGDSTAVVIRSNDLREKVRYSQTGTLIIFVVDASGSMGAQRRMIETKGAIMALLLDAYQRRDTVAMIMFRKETAELILPPTNSVELAKNMLNTLPTGGRTPLSSGLLKTMEIIEREKTKDVNSLPLVVLLSDGKSNVGLDGTKTMHESELQNICEEFKFRGVRTIVIDTETGYVKLGKAKDLATHIGGTYITLEEFATQNLVNAINQNR